MRFRNPCAALALFIAVPLALTATTSPAHADYYIETFHGGAVEVTWPATPPARIHQDNVSAYGNSRTIAPFAIEGYNARMSLDTEKPGVLVFEALGTQRNHLSLFYPRETRAYVVDLSDDSMFVFRIARATSPGTLTIGVTDLLGHGSSNPSPPLVEFVASETPRDYAVSFHHYWGVDFSQVKNVAVSIGIDGGGRVELDDIYTMVPEPVALGLIVPMALLALRRGRRIAPLCFPAEPTSDGISPSLMDS
jgi:hypothetical protein